MQYTPGTSAAALAADAIVTRLPSTRGASVVLHDWGGVGPPLLMAHATGLHGYVWAPMANVLRDRYHCYAVDLRAHGAATRPQDGNFHWDGFGDDIERVLDHLGLSGRGEAFAIGHSMGGNSLVQGELRRPGTFQHVFLFEAIIAPAFPPGQALGARFNSPISDGARRRRAVFASRDEAFQNYASKPPFNRIDEDCLHAYVDHGFVDRHDGSVELACAPHDEAEVFAMSLTNVFERAIEVRCPVTVSVGGRSDEHHLVGAVLLAKRFPKAQYLRLEARTHFGPLERSREFAAVVAQCLAGHPVDGACDPALLADPQPLVPQPETFARSRGATNPIDGEPGHAVAGRTLEEAALTPPPHVKAPATESSPE